MLFVIVTFNGRSKAATKQPTETGFGKELMSATASSIVFGEPETPGPGLQFSKEAAVTPVEESFDDDAGPEHAWYVETKKNVSNKMK